MDIKELFKLAECTKSQAKDIDAWYWRFESLIKDNVYVKVTTYISDEKFAWGELEEAIIGVEG